MSRAWFRPVGFMIAGLLFLMPFVAVSCDAPGGFGRAAPGGTTSYTGVDLVTGGAPDVSPPENVRAGASEGLPVQPLIVRRAVATVAAGAAAVALAANQLSVQSRLTSMVTAQLTVPMPEGKQAADFVRTQPGFWICVITLVLLVMGYGAGWIRSTTRE